MTNLSDKLKAVKSIKRESGYIAGTADALRYLRAQEKYQALLDEVLEDIGRIGYTPDLREVANICEEGRMYLGGMIGVLAEKALKKEENARRTERPIFVNYYNKDLSSDQEIGDYKDDKEINFDFDYKNFLKMYLEGVRAAKNMPESAKRGVGILGSMEIGILGGELKLLNEETGELTLYDLSKRDDLLTDEEDCERIYEEGRTKEGVLERIISNRNPANRLTEEEKVFVYRLYGAGTGMKVYDRMKRERTLRKIDSEKRIALGETIQIYESNRGLTAREAIEETLRIHRKRKTERIQRRTKLGVINAPKILINREEKGIRQAEYTIRAIKNNERWLRGLFEGRMDDYKPEEDDEGEEWKRGR